MSRNRPQVDVTTMVQQAERDTWFFVPTPEDKLRVEQAMAAQGKFLPIVVTGRVTRILARKRLDPVTTPQDYFELPPPRPKPKPPQGPDLSPEAQAVLDTLHAME